MFLTLFLSTGITGFFLMYIWYTEPRRLMLGLSFLLFVLCIGVSIFYLLVSNAQIALLIILAILSLIIFLIGPFIIIGGFLYSGLMLIKREGLRFNNLLSLLFAVALILYLTVWPVVSDLTEHTIYNTFYVYITLLIIFFLVVINLYTITMVLNLAHFSNPDLDYLVVLGAGLDGKRVTPLLASRVDKAIKLYKKNPKIKLIMTGGQGEDEVVAEASAMAVYAIEKGVPQEAIILEDKATNTEENILFSHAMMDSKRAKFAVVTNAYHVFRALLIAKEAGLDCIGFGSRTKWYFTLNAFIREFVGYLYFKRQLYLILLIVYTLIYFLIYAGLTFILSSFA